VLTKNTDERSSSRINKVTMKILEIITTDQLDEAADGVVANILRAPLKAIGKFFGSDRSQLVQHLADNLAAKGKWAGAATPQEAYAAARAAGPTARKLVKNDPQILADAVKQANKVRDPGILGKLSGVGQGGAKATGVIASFAGTLVKWGVRAEYAAQILKPFNDYNDRMNKAKEWVDAGKIPPGQGDYKDVNEWYSAYRSQELTFAISQAAIAVVAAKVSAGLLGKLLGKGKVGAVEPIWDTLKTAGKAYVASQVVDSDTAKDIATLIADNAGVIGQVGAGVVDAAGPAAGAMGELVIAATQRINLLGKQAQAADQGKTSDDGKTNPANKPTANTADKPNASADADKPKPNAQADTTKPADAAKPSDPSKPYDFMGSKSVDPRWAPKEKWKDLGNGYIQDPNTGTIDVRL
jgi:hypothetical protein